MKPTLIKSSNIDCHDYDGVHSSSVFSVEWTQIDEDQQMGCSQELAVSVEYDLRKKEKFIKANSRFTVEENSEVECVN
jgi:hypothetical protein